MTTPGLARDIFATYDAKLARAYTDLNECAADLPAYVEHPECPEEMDEHEQTLVVVSAGYDQYCDAEWDDGCLSAHTDGWDDMTDNGRVNYLMCRECLTVWKMPDEVVFS